MILTFLIRFWLIFALPFFSDCFLGGRKQSRFIRHCTLAWITAFGSFSYSNIDESQVHVICVCLRRKFGRQFSVHWTGPNTKILIKWNWRAHVSPTQPEWNESLAKAVFDDNLPLLHFAFCSTCVFACFARRIPFNFLNQLNRRIKFPSRADKAQVDCRVLFSIANHFIFLIPLALRSSHSVCDFASGKYIYRMGTNSRSEKCCRDSGQSQWIRTIQCTTHKIRAKRPDDKIRFRFSWSNELNGRKGIFWWNSVSVSFLFVVSFNETR